jgi:pimeloyl-ACP methyl ester carboxylesterase
VYAHSWGGAMAAAVVAAGHNVAALITVDPVNWLTPNFQAVMQHADLWYDYNATGGGFDRSNFVAGVGGAWDALPAPYASVYQTIDLDHRDILCAVAPAGCSR